MDYVSESLLGQYNLSKELGLNYVYTRSPSVTESVDSAPQRIATMFNKLMDKLGAKDINDLDSFMVFITKDREVVVKRVSDRHKTDILLMKLFPGPMTDTQVSRAKSKGIRDIAPDFTKINDRTDKRSSGELGLLRVNVRRPGFVLSVSDDRIEPYNIGSGKPIDKAYYLPNVAPVRDLVNNEYNTIFITYDSMNQSGLGMKVSRNLLAKLVGKSDRYEDEAVKISKDTNEILWINGILIMAMSMLCYNHDIDTIVLPSSTGKSISFIRDNLLRIYPNAKVVTIKKPSQKELLDFYDKNRSKYDKEFNDIVLPSYYRAGKSGVADKLRDPFYTKDNELYNIWSERDSYEEDPNIVIKMTKISGYFHRRLISRIMSDYVIATDDKIKDLGKEILVVDDDITTGATLTGFVLPIIRSQASKSNIYPFAIFGRGNNPTDMVLGVDYSLTRADKTKMNK